METVLQLIAQTSGITLMVKIFVDIIKANAPADLKPGVLPMAALGLGLLFAVLLILSTDPVWTPGLAATTVLRGVIGGAGAVATTELHKMARGQR